MSELQLLEPPASVDSTTVQTPEDAERIRQTANILSDLEEHLTYREIAKKHQVSMGTITRIAAEARGTDEYYREAVRQLMTRRGVQALDAWTEAMQKAASNGKHEPAKDLLVHAKLIEPVAATAGAARTNIAIVLGKPE